jgi:hypothetical protein
VKRRNHNPVFDKQVADVALTRGLSRASVLCALLVAAGKAHTQKIAPDKYEKCFAQLAVIPGDVGKSAAFNNLCQCREVTNYDVHFEEEAEMHTDDCLYVRWRELIGDPLESILADDENETRQ